MKRRDEHKQEMRNKVIQFIEDFTVEKGYPPTLDEIGDGVGLQSKATVSYYLAMLKADGIADWETNKPRTIRLYPSEKMTPPRKGE